MGAAAERAKLFLVTVVLITGIGLAASGGAGAAITVTEFGDGLPPGSSPMDITLGPDGNVWFGLLNPGRVGRITPRGEITTFPAGIDETTGGVFEVTAGPDGNVWYTAFDPAGLWIGRMTAAGVATVPPFDPSPDNLDSRFITTGPDGKIWFGQNQPARIVRVDDAGPPLALTGFNFADAFARPSGITTGPDGNFWVTGSNSDSVFRITTAGVMTEFNAGITLNSTPLGITAGPDGNVWFTEQDASQIAKIEPGTGTVTEYGTPTGEKPHEITTGPDGNLWFTELFADQVGRITPAGVITEFGAADGISPGAEPQSITAGPGQSVWFTNQNNATIGRISGFVPPPDTVIETGPSGTITGRQATFTFRGDPITDTDRIECRIDGEPFATCTSPHTFTGLANGSHTAEFRAENLLGEATAAASRSFTIKLPVPKPVAGRRVVVRPARGRVRVRVPGSSTMVPIEEVRGVPVGSVVDTRNGTVVLTVEQAGKQKRTARFRYGRFKITQPKKGRKFTVLKMRGPVRCGATASTSSTATTSKRRRAARRLWGRGRGRFRIRGRRGSGSARGTTWQVTDRCNGTTLVKSIKGRVLGIDYSTGRRKILRTGRAMVAGKPRRRSR